jgi:hypothetical protein
MQKYIDVTRALQNYSSFDSRWARIQKDFNEFGEHLDNLEKLEIKNIETKRHINERRIDISAYGREFSAQLFAVVVGEQIRGTVKFYERLSNGETREVSGFRVDSGYIHDIEGTNPPIPTYDSSSTQMKYWINLIDLGLSLEPQLSKVTSTI